MLLPIADCRLPIVLGLSAYVSTGKRTFKSQLEIGNRKSAMISPTHHDCAPGNASSEGGHQDHVALAHPPGFDAFIKSNRNRCRRSIAMHCDIRIDARRIYLEHFGDGVRNSLVGLMRNE